MQIRLELPETQVLFIALFYFPPEGSKYAEANNENQGASLIHYAMSLSEGSKYAKPNDHNEDTLRDRNWISP